MIILSSCGCFIGSWTLTLTLTLNLTLTLTLIGYLPSVCLSSCTWFVTRLLPISSQPRKCSIWSFYVVAVLVAAFPIWCVVLGIIFLYFCGGLLDGALSSSLHSLILLVPNIFWIVFGILCIWSNGIACTFLFFVLVVFFRCILHLSLRYLFLMVLEATCVTFLPRLFWCIWLHVPWCIVLLVRLLLLMSWRVWLYVRCWELRRCFGVLLLCWIKRSARLLGS